MPVISKSKLLNNPQTAESLNEKHQLNPKNNGVSVIDNVLSLDLSSNKLCMGSVTAVKYDGMNSVYKLDVVDHGEFLVAMNTQLLITTAGNWGSVKDGHLTPGGKVAIYEDNELRLFTIKSISPTNIQSVIIDIRVSNRQNYILDSGLVVHTD